MAATIFDLPPYDVLFPHIFSHLEVVDIWKLRRVCKDLHKLCWDYFTNVCSSLSFPFNDNHLGADAGVVILRKCTKLEELEINGSHNQENKKWLHKLLSSLIEGDSLVRKLHFKCVCIDSTMFPLLDGLSKTCHQLTHLELFRTEITEAPVQFFLFQMLKHTNGTLQELSMNCLNLTPDHPPLINMLTGLIRFSVAYCYNVSSGGCLEEIFRRCPLLEVIDLRAVKTVNDRTLKVLVEYCGRMKQLFVEGCPLMTMEPLIALHQQGVIIDVQPKLQKNSAKIPGQI